MMARSTAHVLFALAMFIAPALLPEAAARAGDPQRGLQISETCQACHGREGNLVLQEDYPKLAGQHADYLAHALRAYRDGGREHAIMQGIAGPLSDRDIRDLAAWYASQQGLVDLRIP